MALTDNLVSYWKFDETSGNAADSVGSNTLTNNGTTPFVAGKINNGADLERDSSQYFSITDASQTGLDITGDLSFSCWVNVESNPPAGALYTFYNKIATSPTRGPLFLYGEDGGYKLQGQFFDSSGNQTRFVKTSYTLTAGNWYHIVFTCDVSVPTIKCYVNGSDISLASDLTAATSIGDNASAFELGKYTTEYFDGIIDEFGIWSRELSSTEVTSLYNSGNGLQYPFVSIKYIPFPGAPVELVL